MGSRYMQLTQLVPLIITPIQWVSVNFWAQHNALLAHESYKMLYCFQPKERLQTFIVLYYSRVSTTHLMFMSNCGSSLELNKSHGSYDPLQSSKQERSGKKRKWKNRDTFNVEWVGMIYIHIRIEFCFVCNHALTLPNHEALISLLVLLKSSHQGGVHVCRFTIFEPMEQKLLNLDWNLSLKIN